VLVRGAEKGKKRGVFSLNFVKNQQKSHL